MPELDTDIGGRMRAARLQKGRSLRAVAGELGVSPSLLSQIETGKTQPSVSTLYAIATHLGLSVDEILGLGAAPAERGSSGSSPSPVARARADGPVQHAVDNPVLEMENGVRWERLAVLPGGSVNAVMVTYAPGAASSVEGKLMRHEGVEHAYLMEGRLILQLEFDEFELGPGDSVCFASVRPHMFRNPGSSPARGIWHVADRYDDQQAAADGTESRADLGSPSTCSARWPASRPGRLAAATPRRARRSPRCPR